MDAVSLSTLHVVDDAYVCCVGGDLDDASAGLLGSELDAIQARGGRRVIVDLCRVRYLDATGLGLLLLAGEQLRSGGGELVVVTDDPRVLRLLEVPGATGRFRLERTLAEAVNGGALGLRS